jgi:ubiquinone/menaquinone biosynthesis C-methylase UbiE
MIDEAEESISKFYNTLGWETIGEVTEDARRWEDLREHSKEYVSKCRLRVLRHIPESGLNILDMASGPIQYKEYLEYSKNFKNRYCVDLSFDALEIAKRRIGKHGIYFHGSFFDMSLEENFFDCTISLHTIYHIDKFKQEDAVRKLIFVTKPSKPIIIVYSNPNSIFPFLGKCIKITRNIKNILNIKKITTAEEESSAYFYSYPNEWWGRFGDVATVKILPWRSLYSYYQKKFIPNNKLGAKLLNYLFYLEDKFPNFFVKYFQYPMIIITKNY